MAFTAQELNHKITFERLETIVDPVTGYREESWVEVGSAYARVDQMMGRERLASQRISAQEVTKFTTRHLTGITPTDRLIYDGNAWDMQSIVNVGGRNREALIYATRN